MLSAMCRIVEEQTLNQLQTVSVEDRANEGMIDNLENPAAKNFPASWTFTQMSKQEEETLGEVITERVPSPQSTTEHEVAASELGQSSAHVEPSHTGLATEYQSEGEEDDLYLDVPEPSVLPKPTDACELDRIRVHDRRWMLTLLQRVFYEAEVVEPHQVDDSAETSAPKEHPSLFGMAAKALPTPTLAVLQNVAFALLTVDEDSEKRAPAEVVELHDLSQFFVCKIH